MPTVATASIFTATQDSRSASPLPPTHSLRILIVDDNHVNLSILNTLLKRRFGHVLARPPVSLDSGLKALQLLRTEIFDLIFMDIEMPYLDGVECTRRIRAAEDGILAPNRYAHVVAVTTNVGPEPAALYRHVGMDGMISKPVRFQNFQQYLCPLSIEALEAKGSVTPVLVGSEQVLPPMPPIDLDQRLFFVPTANGGMVTTAAKSLDRDGGSPTTEYSDANQFAAMLKAQTYKSLRDRKALSISRSATLSEPRRSSFNSPRSEHLPSIRVAQANCAVSKDELLVDDHCRGRKQGAGKRDADNVSGLSFESLVERETRERELDCMMQRRAPVPVRPVPIHRISSPAYMLDASPICRVRAEPAMRSDPDLAASRAVRPDIHPVAPKRLERLVRTDSEWSSNSGDGSAGNDSTTRSSSAWSNTPLSSEWTTTTQRSVSADLLGSFSNHRATSPSSALTTPVSSPVDMKALDDRARNDGADNDEDEDDADSREALFSPCADDLLGSRAPGLEYLDSPVLPSFPPLSKCVFPLQNSPRIRVCDADDQDESRMRNDLGSRMNALQLD
ncbi:hypothetical protein EX895_002074 [Sporisorium graminicola]|uniref:Response regulatory domain-containing protein n=1 Tax=Sporisorium graminicola TaxID=280036 RepID=A0A4U7KW41_9BASI|nr:hypothetical protein EX895_002074 [Sporisorium graminicola]TKY88833.1 hypothetical protein EX895_002074 [Sporisorium graminicola]